MIVKLHTVLVYKKIGDHTTHPQQPEFDHINSVTTQFALAEEKIMHNFIFNSSLLLILFYL